MWPTVKLSARQAVPQFNALSRLSYQHDLWWKGTHALVYKSGGAFSSSTHWWRDSCGKMGSMRHEPCRCHQSHWLRLCHQLPWILEPQNSRASASPLLLYVFLWRACTSVCQTTYSITSVYAPPVDTHFLHFCSISAHGFDTSTSEARDMCALHQDLSILRRSLGALSAAIVG